MGKHFLAHSAFEKQHQDSWLADNPFSIETKWEIATFNKKEPVYRLLLNKDKIRQPIITLLFSIPN